VPIIEITITAKQDGVPLPNFPFVRRIQAVEQEGFNFAQPTSASFVAVPGLPLSTGALINALVLTADQAIAVHLNNQNAADAGILLNAGGLLILIDSNFASLPLVTIQNNSGQTSNIKGLAAGT